MAHTALIRGQDLVTWSVTLPDQVHLTQGLVADTDPNALFLLDANPANPPLTIRINYDPAALFGEAHGILTLRFVEPVDPDFVAAPGYYANEGNGLRGTIQIVFENDLGVPLHAPATAFTGGTGTLALFLGGDTDVITSPAYTSPFHTPYAHLHAALPPGHQDTASLALDFPYAKVLGQVGPLVGATQGNPTGAPDWILVSQDIARGGIAVWGPLSLHQRDLSPAADNFTLNLMLLDGALSAQEMNAVQAAYAAAHPVTGPIA